MCHVSDHKDESLFPSSWISRERHLLSKKLAAVKNLPLQPGHYDIGCGNVVTLCDVNICFFDNGNATLSATMQSNGEQSNYSGSWYIQAKITPRAGGINLPEIWFTNPGFMVAWSVRNASVSSEAKYDASNFFSIITGAAVEWCPPRLISCY